MSFANKYNRMLSLINYINTESEIEQIKIKNEKLKQTIKKNLYSYTSLILNLLNIYLTRIVISIWSI